MMLTLTDLVSASSNMSNSHHRQSLREQTMERQIQALMNTVSTLTRRLDEATNPGNIPQAHRPDQHQKQALRHHIEESVLQGIQKAADDHREKVAEQQEYNNKHYNRNTPSMEDDVTSKSTKQSAPDPPGIRSPEKRKVQVKRPVNVQTLQQIPETVQSPAQEHTPVPSLQLEVATQAPDTTVRQTPEPPTIIVEGREQTIKLQSYTTKTTYKSWKSDCLLKISLNKKYNNITRVNKRIGKHSTSFQLPTPPLEHPQN